MGLRIKAAQHRLPGLLAVGAVGRLAGHGVQGLGQLLRIVPADGPHMGTQRALQHAGGHGNHRHLLQHGLQRRKAKPLKQAGRHQRRRVGKQVGQHGIAHRGLERNRQPLRLHGPDAPVQRFGMGGVAIVTRHDERQRLLSCGHGAGIEGIAIQQMVEIFARLDFGQTQPVAGLLQAGAGQGLGAIGQHRARGQRGKPRIHLRHQVRRHHHHLGRLRQDGGVLRPGRPLHHIAVTLHPLPVLPALSGEQTGCPRFIQPVGQGMLERGPHAGKAGLDVAGRGQPLRVDQRPQVVDDVDGRRGVQGAPGGLRVEVHVHPQRGHQPGQLHIFGIGEGRDVGGDALHLGQAVGG